MKIIKHGRERKPDQIRFVCTSCRCEFETERKEEYSYVFTVQDGFEASAECPECKCRAYAKVPE